MAKSTPAKKTSNKPLSKSAMLDAVSGAVGDELTKRQVKTVVEALVDVGH